MRPSAATVVACAALFVALGGAGYAAVEAGLPPNSVGTAQLQANAVGASKVKAGALRKSSFKAGQLASVPGSAGSSLAYTTLIGGPVSGNGTVATLNIPQAGGYVVVARFSMRSGGFSPSTCTLTAGSATASFAPFASPGRDAGGLIQVATTLGAAGPATLACQGSSQAVAVRITAIRVGTVTG